MSRPLTDASLTRVETLCDLGRFAEAAQAAGRYLQTAPHDSRALCLLAWAHVGAGDPGEALRAAGAAAAAAPHEEWPHRLASVALQQLGQPAAAVAAALTAVRVDPHSALTHLQLAEAARAHGIDLPFARRAADAAVALEPHLVEAYLAVGAVALAQRRRDDAEAAYRAALRLDPECAVAHHELARLRLGGRHPVTGAELGAAASGFATSLRLDPTAKEGRMNIDLVVADVVGRSVFFVVVAGIIGMVFGADPELPRGGMWVPLLLMVVPGVLVHQFVGQASSAVRAQLRRGLRRPWPGLPAAAFALAALLLVVAALLPAVDVAASAGVALLGVLLRIGLAVQVRRQRRRG